MNKVELLTAGCRVTVSGKYCWFERTDEEFVYLRRKGFPIKLEKTTFIDDPSVEIVDEDVNLTL